MGNINIIKNNPITVDRLVKAIRDAYVFDKINKQSTLMGFATNDRYHYHSVMLLCADKIGVIITYNHKLRDGYRKIIDSAIRKYKEIYSDDDIDIQVIESSYQVSEADILVSSLS